METDSLSRLEFRKDDLVALCDSRTLICVCDRRTELQSQTLNRLSRVDFQGQVMGIGGGPDTPTHLITCAPEAKLELEPEGVG
jgi:hypothetical protein